MSADVFDFTLPSYISQIGIRIFGIEFWLPIPKSLFKILVSKFVTEQTNLSDLLMVMIHSRNCVLNDGRFLYRARKMG